MTRIAIAGGTGVVGAHVVDLARQAGHEAVVLARSTGIDLIAGDGLAAALDGVEVAIDVSSIGTLSAKASVAFFEKATRNLLSAEAGAGVRHHVALSIIGAAGAPSGYYAGKAVQERMLEESGDRWSILRAAQFHEFAAQMVQRGAMAGVVVVPKMLSQPVAAVEVAEELVAIAEGAPQGYARDLAGPRPENMADMVRTYLRATGQRRPVLELRLPGVMGRASADGSLLGGPSAKRGRQTFDEWLEHQR
ncbi:SDR family oxidoreductase [Gryllotalpicola protaetiae]|uniref:3-beta hydroxysteroid dehydrogenase n=1 Tax=Gryllotalpicola protaetiae TaxID=2419771 RepID=A0A387BWH8_9MICO|nr:3-beta hydroxysteroid dehydrogenase [Gryllotalpicola protaetiae]AYG05197.1 3-beta hydroxysteroid dehydrogenase [Gryllotalpicola protaetiae]